MKNIIKTFSIGAVLFLSVTSCGSKISCKDVAENLKAAGYACAVVEDEISLKGLSESFRNNLVNVGIKDVPEFKLTYAVMGSKVGENGYLHQAEAYEFINSNQANFFVNAWDEFETRYEVIVSNNNIFCWTDESAKIAAGI